MTIKPRRNAESKFEMHIYLTAKEKQAVQRIAKEESRSVAGQIRHYIKLGLVEEEAGEDFEER